MVVSLANIVLLGYVSKVLAFGLKRLSLKKEPYFSKILSSPICNICWNIIDRPHKELFKREKRKELDCTMFSQIDHRLLQLPVDHSL